MKLDKDTMVKQKFWFLLGAFALLWIVAVSVLKLGAADVAEAKRKAFDTVQKDSKNAVAKGKNESFYNPWREHGDKFRQRKDVVWADAWEVQNADKAPPERRFVTWPSSSTTKDLQKLLYTDDPIGEEERREYKNSLYKRQLEEYMKELNSYNIPFELAGSQVPFEDPLSGGFAAIMTPVSWARTPPSVEEMWLAQEDFWVKRDVIDIVRDAIDSVAKLRGGKVEAGKDPLPEGAVAHHRYHNDSWQLDLYFAKDRSILPQSTITNVNAGKRVLPLSNLRTNKPLEFRLVQAIAQGARERAAVSLKLEKVENVENDEGTGGYLGAGQAARLNKRYTVEPVDPTRPFEVEEVFDPTNAPVRRIDRIVLPQQSHRTANVNLLSNPAFPDDKPKEPSEGAGGGQSAMPSGAQGAPGVSMPGGPPGGGRGDKFSGMGGPPGDRAGPGGFGGGAASNPTLINGLERNRYLKVTAQCRHLPIGIVLLVDQDHINDVLVAVANSRLRIQTTQVEFQHLGLSSGFGMGGRFPGGPMSGGPGGLPAGAQGAPGVTMPGGKFPPPGTSQPSGPSSGMSGPPRGGEFPGGPTPPGTAPSATDDPNLVELRIYGIASIYERFPAKKKEAADANAPATK
jgi:hypothetical protein